MAKIRLTTLNNKTRKGTYIYIKSENKKIKGKYYKLKENTKIDPILKYYEDKYEKRKQKGTLTQYKKAYNQEHKQTKAKYKRTSVIRQAEQYLRKTLKNKSIEKNIKTGINTSQIINIHYATKTEIQKAKEEMLKTLVLDKEILRLITKEENIEKIKNRIEYRIEYENENGRTLAKTSKFNETPEKVIEKLKKTYKIGEEIETQSKSQFNQKSNKIGLKNINIIEKGTLARIRIQLIFRKG